MKAEELMIGDLVAYVRPKGDIEWSKVHLQTLVNMGKSEYLCNHLLPIPITPEILEKNGFSKNGNIYLLQGTTYRVIIRKYIDADALWDLSMSSLEDGSSLKGKTIRHIHQLQHFMRDFEIEKEIEL